MEWVSFLSGIYSDIKVEIWNIFFHKITGISLYEIGLLLSFQPIKQ